MNIKFYNESYEQSMKYLMWVCYILEYTFNEKISGLLNFK